MKTLITATYNQCNIFRTMSYIQHPFHRHHHHHNRVPPSPSPSVTITKTITITIVVFVITFSILQWIILYSRLYVPSFLTVCDSVQIYSIIVPAEAVWHAGQDRLLCSCTLRMHGPASFCNCSWWHPQGQGEQWGLWPLSLSPEFWKHYHIVIFFIPILHITSKLGKVQNCGIRMVCCFPLQMILWSVKVRIVFSRCRFSSCSTNYI